MLNRLEIPSYRLEKAYNNTVLVLRHAPASYFRMEMAHFRMVLVWNRMVKVSGGCRGVISVQKCTISVWF
ncbi:hypothetical protein [Parapedobacter tibetensis]|uniref:hypothetical protein n=1 Tax=Parapedobacter tibetensis TaxID=2972951 RepID=UPI002152A38F|nr:hypothetical protein [Parapedobacter tibetensis]